jgi:LysR family transcriptional regulator, low CO2-responsive transcriptional regulator
VTFSQLRAFAMVARLGSVSAAAEALHVSEPAVSAQVAALRRDLHDELFVRAGGGIRLTPGGQRLAATAAEITGLVERARREVRESRGERELLRLGVTPTVAELASAPLLDAFTRRRPALEVAEEIVPADAFAELLAERRADVVLGPAPPRDRSVESRPFLRCKLIVVSGPEHPLAARRGLPIRALAGARWLAGPWTVPAVERFMSGGGVRPADVRVFPTEAAAQTAAAAGQGVMLAVAHTVLEPLRRRALARLDVAGTPMEDVWHASAMGTERRSPATSSLLVFLTTAEATHAMIARPGGVPAGRFRAPVHVTIWSEPARVGRAGGLE